MPGSDRYDSAVLVGLVTVPAPPLSTQDNAGTALTTPAVSRGCRRRKDVGELIKTRARAHLRWKEPPCSLSKLIRQLSLDGKEGKSGQDSARAAFEQLPPKHGVSPQHKHGLAPTEGSTHPSTQRKSILRLDTTERHPSPSRSPPLITTKIYLS